MKVEQRLKIPCIQPALTEKYFIFNKFSGNDVMPIDKIFNDCPRYRVSWTICSLEFTLVQSFLFEPEAAWIIIIQEILRKTRKTSLDHWNKLSIKSGCSQSVTNIYYLFTGFEMSQAILKVDSYSGWHKKPFLRLSLITSNNEHLESKLEMIQKAQGWLYNIPKTSSR